MPKSATRFISKNVLILALASLLVHWGLAIIFHPGLYIQDTTDSLAQGVGYKPLSNWHPIFFAWLLKLTSGTETPYFIYFQVICISLSLTFCISFLTQDLERYLPAWILIPFQLMGIFLVSLFPPSGFMTVTVVKDTLFNFVIGAGWISLFSIQTKSLSWQYSKSKVVAIFVVCILASLLRHNGIILITGMAGIYGFAQIFLGKNLVKRQLLFLVGAIISTFLLASFIKTFSDPSQRSKENWSMRKWTIRSDYTFAYLLKSMSPSDKDQFESLVDAKAIPFFLADTYIFAWPPLPLRPGISENTFYSFAENYLIAHPLQWLEIKKFYFQQLIGAPIIHSLAIAGDLDNQVAQRHMEMYPESKFKLTLSPGMSELRASLTTKLGIVSDSNFDRENQWIDTLWTYKKWFLRSAILLLIYVILCLLRKKSFRHSILLSAYILGGHLIIWLPYVFLSLPNMARYYFLSILLVKFQFFIVLIETTGLIYEKFIRSSKQTLIG